MERKDNINQYIPDSGGFADDLDYKGQKPREGEGKFYTKPNKKKVKYIEEEPDLPEGLPFEDLHETALNETEMPMGDFVRYSTLTLAKLQDVKDRIKAAKQTFTPINVTIPGDDLHNFINAPLDGDGNSIIDDRVAECLTKIANYNSYNDANSNTDNTIDALEDALNEDRINDAFPKPSIKFVIALFCLFSRIFTKLIFKKICEVLTDVVPAVLDIVLTLVLGPIYAVIRGIMTIVQKLGGGKGDDSEPDKNEILNKIIDFFKGVLNDTAQLVFRAINVIAIAADPLSPDDKKIPRTPADITVCPETTLVEDTIQEEVESFIANFNDPTLNEGIDKCSDEYKPSVEDVGKAKEFIRQGIEAESKQPINSSNPTPFTNHSALSFLDTTTTMYIHSTNGVKQMVNPQEGIYVADKAQAGLLGFMVTVNSVGKQIDQNISKALALQGMAPVYKDYLCCIVRFLYILIPRMISLNMTDDIRITLRELGYSNDISNESLRNKIDSAYNWLFIHQPNVLEEVNSILTTEENNDPNQVLSIVIDEMLENDKDTPSHQKLVIKSYTMQKSWIGSFWTEYYTTYGIIHGIMDTNAFIDGLELKGEIEKVVSVIDTILSIFMSTNGYTLNINFDLDDIGNFFMAALLLATSETLGVLTTSIYKWLKDEMLGKFTDMKSKFPDFAYAVESCPPLNEFLLAINCRIEGLFAKIFDLIAQMWSEANKAFNMFDVTFAVTSQSVNIQFFRDLLNMLLKWDNDLINFCSPKRTVTDEEIERVVERAVNEIEKNDPVIDPSKQDTFAESLTEEGSTLSIPNPVYAANMGTIDDDITNDGATINAPFAYKEAKRLIEEGIAFEQDEERRQHIMKEKNLVEETIMDCGDEFKKIINDSFESYYNELNSSMDVPPN